jgi:site-specific DNA-methyltransferase (adenine-specific)
MSKFPNNSIDLVITSPPYDDLRTYKGNYDFDFEKIVKELFRVVKKGGVVVWVVGDATINGSETGTSFKQALYFKEIGFNLHDTMIYQKSGTPFPAKTRYNQTFEYMFIFSKGKLKTFNPILKKNKYGGEIRNRRKYRNKQGELVLHKPHRTKEYGIDNNVWYIINGNMKSTCDKVAFNHPAIFPEELAYKHIISWSNEGDVVYDPFLGSGTTIKMAALNNRIGLGSEITSEYIPIINERLKLHNINFKNQ